jgi:plastocyanin
MAASLSLSLLITACSGTASPPASVSLDDCARVQDGVITISADDLEFSAPCMVANAGEAFTIHFENDESQIHNVSLYSDSSKATELMRGDTITGPAAEIDYPVEAMEAGEYYFDCMVHPAMNGTLFVVEA